MPSALRDTAAPRVSAGSHPARGPWLRAGTKDSCAELRIKGKAFRAGSRSGTKPSAGADGCRRPAPSGIPELAAGTGNPGGAPGSRPPFTGGFLLADGRLLGQTEPFLLAEPDRRGEAAALPAVPPRARPRAGRPMAGRGGAGRARRGRGRGGGCGRRAAPRGEGEAPCGVVRRARGGAEWAGSAGEPGAGRHGGRAGERPGAGPRPRVRAAAAGGTARSRVGSPEFRPVREFAFGAAVPACRRLLLRARSAAASSRFGRFVVMELR